MKKGHKAQFRHSLNAENTLDELTAQGLSGDDEDEEIDQINDKVVSTSYWLNHIGNKNWWELLTQDFHVHVKKQGK